MRLIDADALAEDLLYDAELCATALDSGEIADRKELDRLQFEKDCKQNCVWYLTEAHTVDAAPVVRCKDCQHVVEHHYEDAGCPPYIKYTCGCRYGLTKAYAVSENNFCCHGERKGGNE